MSPGSQFEKFVPPRGTDERVDVLTFGEALVGLIAADGLPLQSSTVFRRSVVGAEFNVAAGLARLGHLLCSLPDEWVTILSVRS